MKTGQSLKDRHKQERQESLRELLSKQKHLEQVVKNVEKIENLDNQLDRDETNRLKIATETRLKLLNKYLPDLKAVEHTTPDEEKVIKEIEIRYVKASDENG